MSVVVCTVVREVEVWWMGGCICQGTDRCAPHMQSMNLKIICMSKMCLTPNILLSHIKINMYNGGNFHGWRGDQLSNGGGVMFFLK